MSMPDASVLDAKANTTIAFTDGACKGNPGAGGWGAYLVFADGQTEAWCGGDSATTNNRMELMGAIYALINSPTDSTLEIWTDSSYVKNGITQWIDGWKKKGWKTANKKPVANQDLWQQLDELRQARDVSWHWVKGHAGHEGNEKADALANLGVERVLAGNPDPYNTIAATNTQSTKEVKKNPEAPEQGDWLTFDPLGLDMADELLEEETDERLDNDLAEQANSDQDAVVNKTTVVDETTTPNGTATLSYSPTEMTDTPPQTVLPSASLNDNTPMTQDISSLPNAAFAEPQRQEVTQANDRHDISDTPVAFDGDTSRANPHFVPLLPDPINQGKDARQLIMDTETTGLDASKGDRIIEVGIVEMVGRKFTGEKLHVYINPERGMDEDAIRIHGISEAFLQDKPKFADVAQQLFDFMAGAEVIAHNAPFDIGFLTMEFDKVGLTGFADAVQVTDSLVMAKHQYPGQRNTLDALVKRLNVGKQDRTFHGALLDAEILAEVYLAMTGGQVALAIDEENYSEGGGAHARFEHLASKLVTSSTDVAAHQAWLNELNQQYPALNEVWDA